MAETAKRPHENGDDKEIIGPPPKVKKPLTLTQQNMRKFGIEIPNLFTTEDTKHAPWTDIARKLYREKKTLRDNKYASRWMAWWFEEHEDMPKPPGNPPRSAYFIYSYEKSTELGIFNNKKELKKLGANWKAMSEEEQAPYMERNEEIKAKHEVSVDEYEAAMDVWRKAKKEKPRRSDDKPDCNCAYCLGDETSPVALPDF